MSQQNVGAVTAINGPVLDIRFADGHLPELLNAVRIETASGAIVAEVAQQLGDDVVRCIAMSSAAPLPWIPALPSRYRWVRRLWGGCSMFSATRWTTAPR